MGNDPLLYIDSVKDNIDYNSSNQIVFDSRYNTKKSIARHRLEDIKAMLYFKINILVEIKTKNSYYEGIVLSYNDEGLKLKTLNKELIIPIYDIENVNILKS